MTGGACLFRTILVFVMPSGNTWQDILLLPCSPGCLLWIWSELGLRIQYLPATGHAGQFRLFFKLSKQSDMFLLNFDFCICISQMFGCQMKEGRCTDPNRALYAVMTRQGLMGRKAGLARYVLPAA